MNFNWLRFKSNLDDDVNFKFNIYNPKKEGLIFVIFILILPLITAIFLKIILTLTPLAQQSANEQELIWQIPTILVEIAGAVIAYLLIYKKDPVLFYKTSVYGIFFYISIPIIFTLIISLVISLIFGSQINDNNKSVYDAFISIISMTLAEIFIAIFMLRKTVNLKTRIHQTLIKNWKSLLIIVLCVGMMVIGAGFLASWIASVAHLPVSDNQASLVNPLQNSSSVVVVFYAMFLFGLTVLVAPFVEELVMRDAIFTGCGNRWVGLCVSTIFFALSHVYLTGDLQNIWMYLLPSLLFSLTFVYTNGNVTYTWLVHALANLVSFIVLLVQNVGL